MDRIELICDAAAGDACTALQIAIADAAPKADVVIQTGAEPNPTALQMHLHILRRETDFIIAQLAWALPGADPSTPLTTGPEVEVSVQDSTLSPRTTKSLIQGLLKVTDLPL